MLYFFCAPPTKGQPEMSNGSTASRPTAGRESVAAYCRAQAEINRVDKESEETKRSLNERVKTYRSLLTDALLASNVSCMEVPDGESVVYLRMKANEPPLSIGVDDISEALSEIDLDCFKKTAEKHEHDLPKMVSASVQSFAKKRKAERGGNAPNGSPLQKKTLSISSSKERGYDESSTQNVTPRMREMAQQLLGARKELSTLQQATTEKKKPSIATQKEVEETVKNTVKAIDPQHMTTRVHLTQADEEWTYYLRCKESEKPATLGVRKIVALIEQATAAYLDEQGSTRQYNGTQTLDAQFWDGLCDKITKYVQLEASQVKTVSRLTLNRGAPRK